MNNELYHWKYVKREKKNGKWVYTYDSGATAKKNYEQAQKNLATRNAQERSAMRRNLPGAGVENAAINNWVAYEYRGPYYKKGTKTKLEKKVDDAWNNYKGSPEQKKEARQETVKRAANSAKNWAKDKLGFDEKQAMETAKTKATIATYNRQDTEKKNREWRDKYVVYDRKTDELKLKPGYEKVHELADWQDNYYRELEQEAKNEALITEAAYKKTPLGVYEISSEKINAAVEKGKNRVKNKIGYIEKGISEGLQEDVDYYRGKVKEVEDQIAKTRKEHPDHKGSIEYDEERLKEYREKLGEANKSLAEARDSYMNTPLGKLSKNEQAYEFVDTILNGTGKKKKK